MSTADRDPRRNPIAGDKMQIGRSFFTVIPERYKNHVSWRFPNTPANMSHFVPLWSWRRIMANPEAIVVKRGPDTDPTGLTAADVEVLRA